jgi:hypothetical protein
MPGAAALDRACPPGHLAFFWHARITRRAWNLKDFFHDRNYSATATTFFIEIRDGVGLGEKMRHVISSILLVLYGAVLVPRTARW